jgi:type IV pilus assembly protein PilB
MKLLQELFAQGYLTEQMLNDFKKQIEKSGKTEEDLILSNNIVAESFLFELKSKINNVLLKKIDIDQVSSEILSLIPEESSINYKMAAIGKNGNAVLIGMVYPEDISAQSALRFLASQEKFSYQVCLITPGDLVKLLKKRMDISSEANKALEEFGKEKGSNFDDLEKQAATGSITEDAPIIKMVMAILRHAIEAHASDIHIEPGREKLTVRFRINGLLNPSLSLPLKVHLAIIARIKILAGMKIDENRIPQDGRFSTKIGDKDIDFRVATFPTLNGEKIELRVLDVATAMKTFEELGLEGRNLEIVQSAIKKPYGMILFTGPTGSGKTTTQYAILRVLNKDSVNIVTLEDPIEYSISGVNQSQVKTEIGYTFANGLRQILRQDPNVIMVGEIRDEETAGLAVNAALTGHIVLSTLHTNSSVGVVPRLIDMEVRPFLIPSTLKLVISQRLVRTLCEKCKVKIKPAEKVRNYIVEKMKGMPDSVKIDLPDPLLVWQAKGCEACNSTGYAGRVGLFEVLAMSEELADLIEKTPSESLIFKAAQKEGMLTMEQEGIIKILSGQTTPEEVARATEEN